MTTGSWLPSAGGGRLSGYTAPMKKEPVVKPGNVADRVAHYVVGYIRQNGLSPGSEVPSEVTASAELHVSRGIVREVYRSLNTAGIVDTANGRRPRVSRVTNRALTQLLQHGLSTRQVTAEQILELRRPIEGYAAELAASRRSDDDVAALRREVAAMRAAGTKRDPFVKADIRFHEIIGRATGNPLFGLVASALREAMELSIRAGWISAGPDLGQIIETHQDIVEAIHFNQPERAQRLMAIHFDEARANILLSELGKVMSETQGRSRSNRQTKGSRKGA